MTLSDWIVDWAGTAHRLLDLIANLFPSKMTGNTDFE
jgi:hypothetical protein